MWKTSGGERQLEGAERRLFVAGASFLHDLLRPDEPGSEDLTVGVGAFDDLDLELRRWCVLDVLDALTNGNPPPTLSAWREATVMGVFEQIKTCVGSEDGTESDDFWTTLIMSAWKELLDRNESSGTRVEPELRREKDFDLIIECLADEILWDRDFEQQDIQDLPPAKAGKIKETLNIDGEYFTQAPTFPNAAEQGRLLKRLKELDREEA